MLFMAVSKYFPPALHFLGSGFLARLRFCAVALLALLWVAQPANAQTPDLSGTTTPLAVTPGGDAVVVFPDLTVSDADANPVVMRVRVENPDDLNAGDTLAFSGTPNTSGIQVQFFPAADIIGTSSDTLFGGFASGTPPGADRWQDLLRNLTFAAPAGSGPREIRLFVQVRYSLAGSDSPDTLTRTLNIGAAAPVNSPATGLPTISGTPRVGQTLTAETGAIADANGLTNTTFTYQWLGNDGNLSGQTLQTLALTSLNLGTDISVRVRFTDDDGFNEMLTSTEVTVEAAETNSPPTGRPTVRGLFAQGQELTADTVNVADADGLPAVSTFRYQWHTNDGTGSEPGTNTPITGATSRTYTLTEDEVGLRIGVTVSYTDLGTPPADESVTNTFGSLVTGPAAPLVADAGADQVVDEGDLVTLDGRGSSGPAPGPLSYLWGQDDNSGHDIFLANPFTAQLTFPAPTGLSEDAELVFSLGVSDTSGGFASDEVRVRVRAAASGSNNPPTGRLTIDGDPRSGATLTADTSAIDDADGLPATGTAGAFTYQWFADDGTTNAAIDGATDPTYLLTDAQIDARISLVLRYTDDLGVAERVTSLAVGPVVPANSAPVAVIAPLDPALLLTEGGLTGLDGGISTTLDGSGSSDPDGDELTYLWSFSSAATGTPGGTVTNNSIATPVLTTVQRQSFADTLTISLTVTDPDGLEDTATVEYVLLPQAPIPNRRPTADPEPGNQTVFSGDTVTLDGSSSFDPDLGQTATLTYRWRHLIGGFFSERIPLDGAGTPMASFTAPPSTDDPRVNTSAEFELTVTDTAGLSHSARVTVNIQPNSPPTGAVRITGTPLLGATLTANTDTLGDPDGLPAASTFDYQWQRNLFDIAGATERSYRLTADDAGQLITVTVSYEDTATPTGGRNESLRSDPVGPVSGEPPVVIRGTPTQGEPLVADTSAIDNNPQPGSTFTYQWFANDGTTNAEIVGATNRSYLLRQAEVGRRITVSVRYTDANGIEVGPLTSAPTAEVADGNLGPTGVVRIVGTATQGATLTADTSAITDDDGPASLQFTYQWNTRSGSTDTAISGATTATYTLSGDDLGERITVSVRYTDAEGNAEGPLTSAPTAAVSADLNGTTTLLPLTPGGNPVVIFPDLSVSGEPNVFRIRVLNPGDLDDGDTTGLGAGANSTGYSVSANTGATAGTAPHILFSANANTDTARDPARWRGLLRHVTFSAPAGTGGRQIQLIAEVSYDGGSTYSTTTLTRTLNLRTSNRPTSSGLNVTLDEDDSHTFAAAQFNFADTDSGDSLQQVRIDSLPDSASGSLALNGTAVAVDQVIAVADIPTLVYTPVANANGEVTFTFSVSDGTDFSAAPATATLTVNAVNDPPSGTVTIAGAPVRGENLIANTFDIDDVDGPNVLPFTYQWNRGDGTTTEAISGATSLIYTLTADDVGAQITVSVEYTDADGTDEGPLTSAPTAAILNEPHTISLTGESGTVDEGDDAIFTVTLSALPERSFQIFYSTSIEGDDSAQENDFTPTSGVLSFASNNNLTAGITVPITADNETEGNETFTLTLTVADGSTLPPTFILNPSATSAKATIRGDAGSNTPPTTGNLTATTAEDTTHTFAVADFTFNDVDSGDSLQAVRIDSLPASADGSLALGTGASATPVNIAQVIAVADIPTLVYTPVTNVNGDATFTFSVSDGTDFSAPPATATVTVTPVNDAPTTGNLTATTAEDTTHTFAVADFTFNDVDSGDSLQAVRIDSLPDSADGSLALGTGASATPVNIAQVIAVADIPTLVYTPVTNVNGDATFTFSVSDGTDFSAPPATATVTVTPVNDAPTTGNLTATTAEDTTHTFAVADFTFNDVDSGDSLQAVRIDSLPDSADGSLALGTGASATPVNIAQVIAVADIPTLVYTPVTNVNGDATFTFSVSDGTDFSAPPATATVTVTPVNDAPTTGNLTATTAEDTTHTFAVADFTFNDVDSGDSLQAVRIDSLPASADGSLALGTGASATPVNIAQVIAVADIPTLVYTPVTNVNGDATFTFSVSDGTDFSAPPATATVTVTPVNDAPTTGNLTATTAEDTTHTFAVADFTFNDVDSGDSLQAVRIDSLPASADGSLALGTGASATPVNIAQVIAVADIPTLVYTPVTNVNGDATFTFSVSDGTDFSTAPATATVTVTPVNDAPTIVGLPDKTVVQGEGYSFTPRGDDVDGDTLEYAISSTPSWANFDETTGALTGTPASTDVGNHENIIISVTDNIITTPVALSPFAIAVTATAGTNVPPIANAGANQRVSKGTEVTLDGTGSRDPDGDNSALIYLWERTAGPTEVTLSSTTTARPTFIIPAVIPANPASYTFRLTVNDGQESSDPATVRIFIRPLFQATIANQTFSEGNAITPVTLPEARGGPDSLPSTNTYTLTPLPAGLAFNATSRILSGTPTQDGTFNLTYTATNEFNDTDSLSFNIEVTSAANNPPTTSAFTVTTNEDTDYTFTVANFPFTDTDSGDSLTAVRIDSLPDSADGSLALGTGASATPVNIAQVIAVADIPTLVYTPVTNVNGDATFTFSVSDGTDFSAPPATATVTVNPVDDAPGGLPTISGTPRVGATLTANTSGITDPDGLTNTTFTYQWLEDGGTLSGETSPTLALTATNLGADIEVRVSFTDDAGNNERLTSQAVSIGAAISETVSIAGPTGNVNEGDDATFTVTLSGSPGSAVVVDYATATGTASATDFTATSGTLTFVANTTDLTQTFTVPVLTDSIVEGDESFTATLSANSLNPLPTGFSLGTATATATIGAAGTATVSIAGPTGNVNEGDDATFTVTLSGSPGSAVVVDYATATGTASATDFTATSGTLTFVANTTDLTQTFTVPVLTDSIVDPDESFTATLSANSSNPLPTGFSLGTATATATIGAAGTATVSIAGPTGNVNEGDDATFTVTLSGSPGSAVVVDYATATGTASATDFTATSGTLTFVANTTDLTQTFTVPVLTDSIVEGDESFTATLSANSSNPLPTGFSLGTATATATIGAAGTATVSLPGPG